jgi:hypothetical protein
MIPTLANHAKININKLNKLKIKKILSLLGIGDDSGYRAFWIFGHSP